MTYAETIGQHGLYLLASLLVLFLATGSWPSAIAAPTSQPRSCNVSGTIYSSGQNFTLPGQSPCFKYRCNNGSVALYEAGCEYNGTCRPVNSSFAVGCATYGCTTTRTDDGYTVYEIVIKNAQCQFEGVCHPVGSTFDKGCTTYGCTTGTQDGQTVYKTVINKNRCQDSNGVCRDPGSTFPYKIGGTVYNNCTCSISSANSTSYSCYG